MTPTHTLSRISDHETRAAILRAIEDYRLRSDKIGQTIKQAIKNFDPGTSFDGLDGLPEGVYETPNGQFEAVGSLYLKFSDGNPAESFRAIIKGRLDESGKPQITEIIPRMPNP